VETKPGKAPSTEAAKQQLVSELLTLGQQHNQTRFIQDVLFHPGFPVDVRHNTKIDRLALAEWANDHFEPRRTRKKTLQR